MLSNSPDIARNKRVIYLLSFIIICLTIGILLLFSYTPLQAQETAPTGTNTRQPTREFWATVSPRQGQTFNGGVYIGEYTVGAAYLFVPAVNQKAINCVAFIYKGPTIYSFGIFEGGHVYRTVKDESEARSQLKKAEGYLKSNCKGSPVTILEYPEDK